MLPTCRPTTSHGKTAQGLRARSHRFCMRGQALVAARLAEMPLPRWTRERASASRRSSRPLLRPSPLWRPSPRCAPSRLSNPVRACARGTAVARLCPQNLQSSPLLEYEDRDPTSLQVEGLPVQRSLHVEGLPVQRPLAGHQSRHLLHFLLQTHLQPRRRLQQQQQSQLRLLLQVQSSQTIIPAVPPPSWAACCRPSAGLRVRQEEQVQLEAQGAPGEPAILPKTLLARLRRPAQQAAPEPPGSASFRRRPGKTARRPSRR